MMLAPSDLFSRALPSATGLYECTRDMSEKVCEIRCEQVAKLQNSEQRLSLFLPHSHFPLCLNIGMDQPHRVALCGAGGFAKNAVSRHSTV